MTETLDLASHTTQIDTLDASLTARNSLYSVSLIGDCSESDGSSVSEDAAIPQYYLLTSNIARTFTE
jgi:hypothetical protein